MSKKVVLITGATAGIGKQTALELAKRGMTVHFIARDAAKAEEMKKELIAAGSTETNYFLADFSSQKSIREAAKQIRAALPLIDVLINNAGGVNSDFALTEDGLEKTIATNHFAYFLLTNLLLDLVKKSDHARIINVASGSHYQGSINFDSFTQDKGHFIMKAYAQSKLANVLFTNELARRLSGTQVTVNSLHPGMVVTKIGDKNTNGLASFVWNLATKIGGIKVEKGAETSVFLATSDKVKGVTGKYFDKSKEKTPSKLALDVKLQKQLWEVSERLCPLNA
ncbi:MAG: SDR family oxidoreductase [Chitinophagales bacterium]